MTKASLIDKTVKTIAKLPANKLQEVSDFAEYLLAKEEEQTLRAGISILTSDSKSFDFLAEEEDLYSADDLKEKF